MSDPLESDIRDVVRERHGGPERFAPPNIRALSRPPADMSTGDPDALGEAAAQSIRQAAETAAQKLLLVASAFVETAKKEAEDAAAAIRAEGERQAEAAIRMAARTHAMTDALAGAARKLLDVKV